VHPQVLAPLTEFRSSPLKSRMLRRTRSRRCSRVSGPRARRSFQSLTILSHRLHRQDPRGYASNVSVICSRSRLFLSSLTNGIWLWIEWLQSLLPNVRLLSVPNPPRPNPININIRTLNGLEHRFHILSTQPSRFLPRDRHPRRPIECDARGKGFAQNNTSPRL